MTLCVDVLPNLSRIGLLVSVRDAEEARAALRAGADLIDVKEPRHGPLGRADEEVLLQVLEAVGSRVPVSAALGELVDWSVEAEENREIGMPRQMKLSLVKFGLARCREWSAWPQAWSRSLGQMSDHISPVAVVYADWLSAGAPPPERVLEVGGQIGCRVLLIDTFDKSAGDLFTHWPAQSLAEFLERARKCSMATVVAGSLSHETLGRALALEPNFVAVRGAACREGRGSAVCERRVRNLAARLRETGVARNG